MTSHPLARPFAAVVSLVTLACAPGKGA